MYNKKTPQMDSQRKQTLQMGLPFGPAAKPMLGAD
jgi:hypothetical protein